MIWEVFWIRRCRDHQVLAVGAPVRCRWLGPFKGPLQLKWFYSILPLLCSEVPSSSRGFASHWDELEDKGYPSSGLTYSSSGRNQQCCFTPWRGHPCEHAGCLQVDSLSVGTPVLQWPARPDATTKCHSCTFCHLFLLLLPLPAFLTLS